MTCEELKNKILNKVVDDSLLICIYKDTTFVISQYIKQIAKDKKLSINYVDFLENIDLDSNNFFGVDTNLYVLNTDKVTCSDDLLKYKNTIIVCKDVVGGEQYKDNIVVFDKLTEDQVLEYMQVLCPEITDNYLGWLYDICGGDIYRIDKELQKLKLFPGMQMSMFETIRNEGGYSDLNQMTIYSCINAFINKDIRTINEILLNLDVIDVEGTGLVTLLLRNIKNIIDIQTNSKATPESTHMKDKQFYVVKKQVGKFTNKQLVNMFEFLTGIDYRLKSGLLELTNNEFVGYILTNMMEIGYEKE